MDSFEISELVVIIVYTDAEEEASISPIDDFVVPELGSRSVFISGRSQGGPPRRNWIDISGLAGRLSDALPHVAEPVVGGCR